MKTFLFVICYFSVAAWAAATTRITMFRNEKVIVYDEILHPAENESGSDDLPSITVYLSDGPVQITSEAGKRVTVNVKRGEVVFRGPKAWKHYASGTSEVRFIRIEFRGPGAEEKKGGAGATPQGHVLMDNACARVYEMRIPVGTGESFSPRDDGVVVFLSGAELKHTPPGGHTETSRLKPGQCVWHGGQTQIDDYLGKDDFWAIAVEPK